MKPNFIGMAGGSGAGKSTLARAIKRSHPEKVEILYFDDYFKNINDLPITHGFPDWDHPDSIDFEKLIVDLNILKKGIDLEIMTRSFYLNPTFQETRQRIPHTTYAKQVILVEGYMSLQREEVRDFFDYSIYLDLALEERLNRRPSFPEGGEYLEKVFLPSQNKYVEPTKIYASKIITVDGKSKPEVTLETIETLKEFLITEQIKNIPHY